MEVLDLVEVLEAVLDLVEALALGSVEETREQVEVYLVGELIEIHS